jgi:hypothetical protein
VRSAPAATFSMSCLMVTRDRPAFAARAVRCFADQRYPACKLIGCHCTSDYRRHLADLARQHGITDVAILDAAQDLPLGVLRNRSTQPPVIWSVSGTTNAAIRTRSRPRWRS